MGDQSYKVKFVQEGEVTYESEITLPGEDKLSICSLPFGSFRPDSKNNEILIERLDPESKDVEAPGGPLGD